MDPAMRGDEPAILPMAAPDPPVGPILGDLPIPALSHSGCECLGDITEAASIADAGAGAAVVPDEPPDEDALPVSTWSDEAGDGGGADGLMTGSAVEAS